MTEGHGPPTNGRTSRPPAGHADHRPWKVFVALVPVAIVLTLVASVVGFGYGKSAGTTHVEEELATRSAGGGGTPVASPKSAPPEPFVSSMPRPTRTKLRPAAMPRSLVGPTFDVSQPTTTLSPNLPFSFRAPAGNWQEETPYPRRDIAYATAYLEPPEGGESEADSPLLAAFAWRACGACSLDDVPAFDQRFRSHHDAPAFDLEMRSDDTGYDQLTEDGYYYLVVRHVYESADGNTYLVAYLTRAQESDKQTAQQLANEILTQTS